MSARYTRPGSGSSRGSGRPRGPRRPGRGDGVLPLITGVLGSSILAFSLYALSHKPEAKDEYGHGATFNNEYEDSYSTIRTDKRRWLTELEEQVIKEQNVRRDLADQIQKVSELTEQLQRECALREKLEKECNCSNRS